VGRGVRAVAQRRTFVFCDSKKMHFFSERDNYLSPLWGAFMVNGDIVILANWDSIFNGKWGRLLMK
jgi:hypothetical protein